MQQLIFKTFAISKVVHLTLMKDVPSGAILNQKKCKNNFNTISLSRHEQVCLLRLLFERYFSDDGRSFSRNVALNILVDELRNLLYYEQGTDKRKYFYVQKQFIWKNGNHNLKHGTLCNQYENVGKKILF